MELHKYLIGTLFSTIFQLTKSIKFRLGLTGTLTKEHKEILISLNFDIVDTITLEEGKKNNWCSPIREFNLGVQLPTDEQVMYDKLYEQFASYYSSFADNWEEMFGCMKYDSWNAGNKYYPGAYNYLVRHELETGNEYNDRRKAWELVRNANQAIRLNGEYRNLLYNTEVKLPLVKTIIERMNMKTITFGKSISSADKLQLMIPNSIAIHSEILTRKLPKNLLYRYGLVDKPGEQLLKVSGERQGLIYIKQFNQGHFTTAHSAKKIIEGLDIKGAQLMLNYGFDSSKVTRNQKIGRVNRVEKIDNGFGELIDKVAHIVNIYCIGTKEENWLASSQYKVPGIRTIESLEEIEI